MESVSALLALCEGNQPVTGGFPQKGASGAGFDVSLHERLSKQSSRRWFETPEMSEIK